MNHPNHPPQASYTSTTGHDSLPHTIIVSRLSLAHPHATLIDVTSLKQLAEHRGIQNDYQVPIAPDALQFEYNFPMAPVRVPSGFLVFPYSLSESDWPSNDRKCPATTLLETRSC